MMAGGTDDKRRNVLYSDTLTLLLESVARLIETHQTLIDNFYGPDKLLDLLEIIQVNLGLILFVNHAIPGGGRFTSKPNFKYICAEASVRCQSQAGRQDNAQRWKIYR
jgi:hypothetical protein